MCVCVWAGVCVCIMYVCVGGCVFLMHCSICATQYTYLHIVSGVRVGVLSIPYLGITGFVYMHATNEWLV